jgi:predicted nucleic acid-binding protein
MPRTKPFLLDTGILLHWIRGSHVAQTIDGQFQLQASSFKPLICEVTLGEIYAFSRGENWGGARHRKLAEIQNKLVPVDISDPRVIQAYADISTLAKKNGWALFHEHNDLWIAAATQVSGTTLLTLDKTAFLPLRGTPHLDVIVLDAATGWPIP